MARFPPPKKSPPPKKLENPPPPPPPNQEIVISYVAVPPALTAHRPLRDWRGEDVSARAHESAALEDPVRRGRVAPILAFGPSDSTR